MSLRPASYALPILVSGWLVTGSLAFGQSATPKPPVPKFPSAAEIAAEGSDEDSPVMKAKPEVKPIVTKRQKSAIGSLLFVQQATGNFGQFVSLTGAVQPGKPEDPGELAWDHFMGPLTMKSLGSVMTSVEALHGGWPKGQRITLAFSEKVAPAELLAANLPAALLIDSLIRDWDIDPGYAVIGMLEPDGSVKAVGAISNRLDGTVRARIARLAVPEGNKVQVSDYLLSAGIGSFLGTQIFTVKHYNDAGRLALTKLDPQMSEAVALFGSVQRTLAAVNPAKAVELLREPRVQANLQKIHEAAPTLLSAEILLDWGTGKKTQITVGGSMDAIDRFAPALLKGFRAKNNEAMALPKDQVALEVARLRVLRERVDPQIRPYIDSIFAFGTALQKGQTGGSGGKTAAFAAMDTARAKANEEWVKAVKLRQAAAEPIQPE